MLRTESISTDSTKHGQKDFRIRTEQASNVQCALHLSIQSVIPAKHSLMLVGPRLVSKKARLKEESSISTQFNFASLPMSREL